MKKLYIKKGGKKYLIAWGKEKSLEELKEKMLKDKDKMTKFKIEEITIE